VKGPVTVAVWTILASLLWLWAVRVPGGTSVPQLLSGVLFLCAIATMVTQLVRHDRTIVKWGGSSLIIMSGFAVTFIIDSYDIPKTIAFTMSRGHLEKSARNICQSSGKSSLEGRWIGLYNIDEIRSEDDCVWFRFRDAGVFFRHGIAYCPEGPPPPRNLGPMRYYSICSPPWFYWKTNVD